MVKVDESQTKIAGVMGEQIMEPRRKQKGFSRLLKPVTDFVRDSTAFEALKGIPVAGKEFAHFIIRPRLFVAGPDGFANPKFSAKKAFGWTLLFGTLLFGLYSALLSPTLSNIFNRTGLITANQHDEQPSPATESAGPVKVAGMWWKPGLGVGVSFPDDRPSTEAQRAVFRCGAFIVVFDNVVPDDVKEDVVVKLLLTMYALVFVLCIHPIARLFRGNGTFRNAGRLSLVFFGYVYLFLMLLILSGTLLGAIFISLKFSTFAVTAIWFLAVLLPAVIIFLRCFFGAFCAFFTITRKRLVLVCLGTIISSSIVCPIVLVPMLFLILRFEPLLKVVV